MLGASIRIPKLLMVKYFLKHHSLTLLSYMTLNTHAKCRNVSFMLLIQLNRNTISTSNVTNHHAGVFVAKHVHGF